MFDTEAKWNDTVHDALRKVVGAYQNQAGADPANDPKSNDTIRDLEQKWDRARINAN